VDVDALAEDIDAALAAQATPGRAEQERAYLRSDLEHYGTSVPAMRAVVKGAARRKGQPTHGEVVELAERLWSKPVHERRMAAVEVLKQWVTALEPADIDLLERLLRESRTWALVDDLAGSVVGPLVEHHPEVGTVLDRWAADPDYWIRRAALLALLGPMRRGAGDFERFARYADNMLEEREFFIRKAIGWVLRDTAKKRPDVVFEWLLPRAARASGVTLREALKPLSEEQRAAIQAAR
jgi:3-methyladenine DNA glycosylase AlkD